MKIKGLTDEDFVNYKKPSMFIIFNKCDFKCDKENGTNYCYNMPLIHQPDIEVSTDDLYTRYINNPITKAIVCGGLEPFDSVIDLFDFISAFRLTYSCNDDIVIYTGYTENEILSGFYGGLKSSEGQFYINSILKLNNIIIKYGRYRPNNEPHFDHILGINLASDNQYAKMYNMKEQQ